MSSILIALLCLSVFCLSLSLNFSVEECDNVIAPYCSPGDVNFGFFSKFQLNCSNAFDPTGILIAMTAQWAVEKVNLDPELIFHQFNLTLSLIMFETCDSFCRVLQQQHLCRPSWLQSDSASSRCEVAQDASRQAAKDLSKEMRVSAVIADVKSFEAALLLRLFGLRHLPMVGLKTSAASLTKTANRQYFVRMVPNDSHQTSVLIDLLRRFHWSYPIVLYERDDSYGLGLYHALKTQFDDLWRVTGERFCIALSRKYKRGKVTAGQAKNIFEGVSLLTNSTRVVILLGDWDTVLMRSLASLKLTFIFVDSVSEAPSDSLAQTEGSIFISFPRGFVPEVLQSYNALTWKEASRSLPFGEYYFARRHNCCFGCHFRRSCRSVPPAESWDFSVNASAARTHTYPLLLVNAIWALARAFSDAAVSNCFAAAKSGDHKRLSACVDGPALMAALRTQQFPGFGMNVSFDREGDGPPLYVLMQQVGRRLHDRGNWTASQGLQLGLQAFCWPDGPPVSRCSAACAAGEVQRLRSAPCCWHCERCRSREVASNGSCVPCRTFFWPDEGQRRCRRLPVSQLSRAGAKAGLNFGLAAAGSLAGLVTLVAFAMKRNSRLVKASATELVVLMLSGLLLAHLTVFSLFFRELTSLECCVKVVAYNLSLTFAYAALLVKSVRIFRLFNTSQQGPAQLRFVSTAAVVGATLILCFFQVSVVRAMVEREVCWVLGNKEVEANKMKVTSCYKVKDKMEINDQAVN